MSLMKKIVIVLIVCMPVTVWSGNLHYALDIQINTSEQEIIGTARLKSDTDKKIGLSIRNLREIKVNGSPVNNTADERINLTVQRGEEIIIRYSASFADKGMNLIDKDHVFLTQEWYPRPDLLTHYALAVTLPDNFIAVSEAESVTIQKQGQTKTFNFQFNHPLDALHLVASTRYGLKKDKYNNTAIEVYFFKEKAQDADSYIAYTKEYLEMYENMLTPYPYRRFAIVEHMFANVYSKLPSGNAYFRTVVKPPIPSL